MSAYEESLIDWVSGLDDETITKYMGMLERFNDAEFDALFKEDARRIFIRCVK